MKRDRSLPLLVVDGYNIIHAWKDLKPLIAQGQLEAARDTLVALLAEYATSRQMAVSVVFDARSADGPQVPMETGGVTIYFGNRRASADHIIERLVYEAARDASESAITVATSDRLQASLVQNMGAATISAAMLEQDVQRSIAENKQENVLRNNNAQHARRLEERLSPEVRAQLESLRRGTPPSRVP